MRGKRLLIVVISIIIIAGFFVSPGFFLVSPGTVEDLDDLILMEGEPRNEEGNFLMVTVAQREANLWGVLYGLVNPIIDVRPLSRVIPPDMTEEEYNELMQSWMEDSKNLAQVIALRKQGYEVPIESDGVEIVELLPNSPVQGTLFPGDVIRTVEGKTVDLAEEVVSIIQEKEIGEEVQLTIEREGKEKPVEAATTHHTEEADKAALRVYVRTLNWRPIMPFDIDIETGPVIGPSAGIMFVLEIMDRLSPENLTSGHTVAGTGTITLQEEVGGIGGVKQKVVAAERQGADYFLVPKENYEEAQGAADEITLVPLKDLDDALDFLKSFNTAEALLRPGNTSLLLS